MGHQIDMKSTLTKEMILVGEQFPEFKIFKIKYLVLHFKNDDFKIFSNHHNGILKSLEHYQNIH